MQTFVRNGIIKHDYGGELCDMGDAEGVTTGRHLLLGEPSKRAAEKRTRMIRLHRQAHNLHIDSADHLTNQIINYALPGCLIPIPVLRSCSVISFLEGQDNTQRCRLAGLG